jgi:hypothetical protein
MYNPEKLATQGTQDKEQQNTIFENFQDTRFILGKIPHGTDKYDRCIGHTRMIIFYVKKQ